MKDSRSAEIAREIRARIEAGTLAPGDKAPSARQITREWGVAIATATKVLNQLQDEGLVKPMSGIGTVVLPTRAATSTLSISPELSRDRIVACAIAIADREGIAGLSMRAIAGALGVATMSLYRHLPGKDELIVFMIDAAIGEGALPTNPPKGWRARLELLCRLQWWGYRRHPWLAHVLSMARPQLVPNGMAQTDWAMRALEGTGLDLTTIIRVAITLVAFTRSHALDIESERQAALDSGLTVDEWLEQQAPTFVAITESRSLRMLSRVKEEEMDLSPETLFEFGLTRLLDGVGVLIG